MEFHVLAISTSMPGFRGQSAGLELLELFLSLLGDTDQPGGEPTSISRNAPHIPFSTLLTKGWEVP